MPRAGPFLTDEQWERIQPLLPRLPKNPQGGRPWADNRRVLEGILWMLRTGARWQDLPEQYPSPPTCWRRLQRWEKEGVGWTSGGRFLANSTNAARLIGAKRSLMAVLLRRKRGRPSRQNQAGQGHEVDGGGRRPGSSSGKPASLCIPGGSPARGHPGSHPGPATAEAGAGNCRQGLRQRPAAGQAGATPHRTDRAPSPRPS